LIEALNRKADTCGRCIILRSDAFAAKRPYGLGRPATFNAGRPPQGAEVLEIWKWRIP
jgi:hypothetical protein